MSGEEVRRGNSPTKSPVAQKKMMVDRSRLVPVPEERALSTVPVPVPEHKDPAVFRIDAPNGEACYGKEYYRVGEQDFDVDSRYVPQTLIGQGAYAVVCSALDRATGKRVAIKKIELYEEPMPSWCQMLREIAVVCRVNHPFIYKIRDIMRPSESNDTFKTVYVVFDLAQTDFSREIRHRSPISVEDCKLYLNQILRALDYLHSREIVHRDLKPANILVDRHKRLKLADFGLSRTLPRPCREITDGEGTYLYKAPEVLMHARYYTEAVDMWSAGVVFARMLDPQGRHPFNVQEDSDRRMLAAIADIVPLPRAEKLRDIVKRNPFLLFVATRPPPTTSLDGMYPEAPPLAIDLLKRMLQFHPMDRITAAEALRHPFISDITTEVLQFELALKDWEVRLLNDNGTPDKISFDGDHWTQLCRISDEEGRAKVWKEMSHFWDTQPADYNSATSSACGSRSQTRPDLPYEIELLARPSTTAIEGKGKH